LNEIALQKAGQRFITSNDFARKKRVKKQQNKKAELTKNPYQTWYLWHSGLMPYNIS